MTDIDLNPRAQQLLKVIVERYIQDGQPLASKALAVQSDLAVSPATIRSIMADLEEHGLLHSPHTSAGRVPTPQAYRFFVNSLLTVKPLNAELLQPFKDNLEPVHDEQALVESTSKTLSQLSQLASLVTLPKREHMALRHIEFLPLSGPRVLVIVVYNEKEVQNRIIHTDRVYQANELEQIGNYLTSTFAGKDLHHIRDALLAGLSDTREAMDNLMRSAIKMAEQALKEERSETDCVISGQGNLLGMANQQGLGHLQELFNAFTEKQKILSILDKCLQADGVHIFIGEDSPYDVLDGCSLITAPYNIGGDAVGVLGVIGPHRMPYEEVIPLVDITAKILSSALKS